MSYSIIGIIAIVVHLIINVDLFRGRGDHRFPAGRDLRRFLQAIIAYHATDAAWGLLYERRLTALVYADTVIYFAAMALSVLLWTLFAVHYLEKQNRFRAFLVHSGRLFFAFQMVALAVNGVQPVFFYLDAAGDYQTAPARYAVLVIQILMFLLTSVYSLYVSAHSEGTVRRRHLTIGLFGLAMILFVVLQVFYPLQPMYSIGCLLGGCVLHTFVVEDEKIEYMRDLEESLRREERQRQELGAARRLVYTDPLTGVKSKSAYMEAEARMDGRIAASQVSEFAVAVFDLNGLKHVNDTLGHEAGDALIVAACRLVCVTFKHSPVFRVGGDEFAAIMEGADYEARAALLADFNRQIEENRKAGQVVVAAGMSDFDPARDKRFGEVFQRADEEMYRRKAALKGESMDQGA